MGLLNHQAVLRAAHVCYALEYDRILEERGIHEYSRQGTNLVEAVEPVEECRIAPIAYRMVGAVEQAWGFELGLILFHMGAEDEETQYDVLRDLFLGLCGHGVSITDDWEAELENAEEILCKYSGKRFDMNTADTGNLFYSVFYMPADEVICAKYGQPEDEE